LEIAKREGVELRPGLRIARFEGTNDKLDTVVFRTIRSKGSDGVGRPALLQSAKEEPLDARLCVCSVNRRSAEMSIPSFEGIHRGPLGNLQLDSNYRLGRRKWYAAGEVATAAATVVDSMGTGRLAAESIIRDLNLAGDVQ